MAVTIAVTTSGETPKSTPNTRFSNDRRLIIKATKALSNVVNMFVTSFFPVINMHILSG